MADVSKPMYSGQPGTTDTLLYTAPATAGNTATIRGIHIVNTSGTTRTVTLGIRAGAALAAANHFLTTYSLAPGAVYDWSGHMTLAASETIRALQENATACTFHISGIEST